MNKIKTIGIFILFFNIFSGIAQHKEIPKNTLDSLYISETESPKLVPKVLHAEPLFVDLIRDLGARKGEREWNVAFGLTDNKTYDTYQALVEYEWAPIDHLGFEIEIPFTFHFGTDGNIETPGSKMDGLKLATQYSFYVSEKHKTSLAIGYIHEFEWNHFNQYGTGKLITGQVFNPFFVAAKRWGNNFHTLIYTGPQIEQHFGHSELDTHWEWNTNIHYMIPGTKNFIGIEFNKEFRKNDFDMTIRPQMRLEISDNLMIGIVAGIPINRENQRLSSFLRLIYEPKHK